MAYMKIIPESKLHSDVKSLLNLFSGNKQIEQKIKNILCKKGDEKYIYYNYECVDCKYIIRNSTGDKKDIFERFYVELSKIF